MTPRSPAPARARRLALAPMHGPGRRGAGRTVTAWAGALLALGMPLAVGAQPTAEAGPRVVSLGGAVTETVFALGLDSLLVGVDRSSVYPPEARDLPDVGYFRTLGAEGVLSLAPEVVLAAEESGPPTVLRRLREAGVRLVEIPSESSPAGAVEKVRRVAGALGVPARGHALAEAMEERFAEARRLRDRRSLSPRVLFVWSQGGGSLLVSGTGTSAATMLELAGAENAVTGFEGFKPLTAEAAVAAGPDVVVVPRSTLERLGGVPGLLAVPGLSATPAAREGRVVTVEILSFIGFGPRTADALVELMRALHPELEGV